MKWKTMSNYGDILAVPLFAILAVYFYNMENKSPLECVLFIFAVVGFVVDVTFTYIFFS